MQLGHNNQELAPDVDSVFFMTSVEQGYISSSLAKEIAPFRRQRDRMVPPAAAAVRSALEAEVRRRGLGAAPRSAGDP